MRDDAGNPLGDGETGELWVSGPLVGRGYLARPELTAERFVTDAAGVRHYRTGDLVRRVDGLHHFAGRIDDQVKVRGFRIELGEVEATLAGHPAVQHAVALAPADEDGTRLLLAYAESADRTLTEAGLRSWLRDRLPDHLVPSRIAVLDRLPVGPTGKTDRAALAALAFGRVVDTEYAAPRTGTEQRIAETVAGVLGLGAAEVGIHDDFGALGGHSLAAARVCAVLGREFGTGVSLTDFLAAPTVAGLASLLASLLRAGSADRPGSAPEPALVRHTGRDSYPLTAAQQGMWLLRQIGSGERATTIAFRLRLRGLPGTARLRAALDAVVERHEVLRSVVLAGGAVTGGAVTGAVVDASGRAVDEEPVASVRPPAPVPFEEHDLRGVSGPEQVKQAAELTRAAASHAFDLATETPLLRAALLRLDEDEAELVVVTDHVAFDGWSIGVLMSELVDRLAGRADDRSGNGAGLAPPPVQVGDIALHERALAAGPDRVEELRAFWARELADAVPPHDLLPAAIAGLAAPAGPGRPGGERLARPLDAGTAAVLRELAADCGSTSFATFLTALGVLVAGLTGRSDVVLGAAVAHRAHPELEAVVGPLVGISPIRLRLAEGESFRSAVGRAAATTARVMDHPGFTVQDAFEAAGIGHPRGTMGTPVVLSLQPAGLPVAVEHEGVRLELLGEATGGGTQAPLTVFVNETVQGPELRIAYDTDRFGPADAEAFADRLLRILCAAAADPDLP
ncbi:condensation domain-containing protein, partial [Streptomyces sp. NRRL S-495]|uniref:condensation domain-containing protein n=1 Tax=Streptomyces sp. NRRL S-495 TaxID=1609133 RepID=UPI0005F9099B